MYTEFISDALCLGILLLNSTIESTHCNSERKKERNINIDEGQNRPMRQIMIKNLGEFMLSILKQK